MFIIKLIILFYSYLYYQSIYWLARLKMESFKAMQKTLDHLETLEFDFNINLIFEKDECFSKSKKEAKKLN